MKLDRITVVLAALALASLCVAQRVWAQNAVASGNAQIGTPVLLGTRADVRNFPIGTTVQVTPGKYARLSRRQDRLVRHR